MSEMYSDQMPITPPDTIQRRPVIGNTSDTDGLQGPFLVIEGGRPPDIFFDNLSIEQFLPTTSVIEVTHDARLRTGLRNIAGHIDDPEIVETYLSPDYRQKQLKKAKTFFTGKITILDHQQKRDELIDLNTAVSHVIARLMDENDPVAQYISQLTDALSQEENVNIGALNVFLRSLLAVTHWPMLRSVCLEQIERIKNPIDEP